MLDPPWYHSPVARVLSVAHCDGRVDSDVSTQERMERSEVSGTTGVPMTLERRKSSLRRRASAMYVPKPPGVFVPQGKADGTGVAKNCERDVLRRQEGPFGGVQAEEDSLRSLQLGAWAGGIAGVVADTLMHPFDTISTRLKCQVVPHSGEAGRQPKYNGLIGTARVLIREEGVLSLLNGVSATILCAVPSSAVYFGTYEGVKSIGLKRIDDLEFARDIDVVYKADAVHLTAGICSELAASVFVVPFEVVKSRMQIGGSPYHGAMNGIYTVARQEGVSGLFAGYRACLTLDCTFSAIQFLLYERLKRDIKSERSMVGVSPLQSQQGPNEQTLEEVLDSIEDTAEDLVAGALSGGIAAFISNPLDVAATRLMTQDYKSSVKQRAYSGMLDCLSKVARREGVKGLWSGSLARVLSIAPLSAITFGIYEKIKFYLTKEM